VVDGSWAGRPPYPPNRTNGSVYVSRLVGLGSGLPTRAEASRLGPRGVTSKLDQRWGTERTTQTNYRGAPKTGRISDMGRHRRRTFRSTTELSWSARVMTTIRSALRNMMPSSIHRHQATAQHEINHATAVVEQQKRETDLLAEQVWRAMGGHP